MRVIVTSTYSGKQRVFEGDSSSVYLQLVARYPFLESYEEGHHGNLVSLLEYLNSMQAYDAYVEGAEELEQEDIDDELSELGLEDDELGKSLSNMPLYLEYEDLEKGEKLPHYLKFMGNHPKAQETAEWADSNLNHRNLAEFAMRHAKTKPEGLSNEEKTTIKHFGDSLHMPEVQNAAGQLNNKHNFETGIQLLQNAQDEYSKRHAASAPKLTPVEGQKLLDLGEGVAVYNLPLNEERKNENEATAMSNCGTPHEGGELWSIRKDHGNGMVEPMVTIAHEGGYIGEVKGKYNWKPHTRYHPYIAKLMASDLVRGFVNGGYAPESNFEFSDMKDGLRRKLLEYKPELTAKVYKELLPEGFQGNYSHVPEVKSIFNSNDVKAQIEFLERHEPGSKVHEDAAWNPNISPETLHHLVTVNKPGSDVHAYAAKNPNISPELLHHLVTVNKPGSDVHAYAGKNPNISSELLHHLITVNGPGSWIHYDAAKNPKISQELLHHLVTTNKPDSSVHRNAAKNPNISQELLHHLVTTNKPDSSVHHNATENPNISPESLHHLVTVNKPGSGVHYYAALNPNISQETLHHLVTTNKPGSVFHENAAKNPNISPELLHHLVTVNKPGSGVNVYAAKNPNISQELLHHLVTTNEPGSWTHHDAAENPNISQETLHHLVTVNKPGSDVNHNAAQNPQFSKLPLETQKIARPLAGENIQKVISLMNDENNPEQAKIAQRELLARRKARYDKILSPEGNLEELQHLAESHDEGISKRARAELKRRGLSKSEDVELELQKSDWGTPLFQTHDWKYLGSGHQGHVYQASPEAVVKVSKTTPFNKMNPLKTPLQARNDVMDEHDSISGMQGHPLAPKHYGTWRKGSKVYLAREALTPIKDGELNESDLDYVREQMYDAFKSGYMPIDRIQLGRNSQGQIKIMDMGGMKKRTSNSSTVANWDKQDLTGHLRYLFSKHGEDLKSHKHIPTEILQEEVGRFSKLSDFLGSKQEFVDWKNSRTNELARRAKATESPVTKSENIYPNLLNGDRDSVLEVARYMLGFQQNSHDIFEAARFLVAGQTVSLDRIRRAIYETDGDVELAALKAYGLETNESNLKALRAVLKTQNLSKSSQLVQVREAVPALPEGYDAADAIKRAADSGNLTHIKLHGKHSVGSLLAMDPEEERFYLLKPNFGGPGPAAGAQEEKATPAKREAAFSHVAQEWGLSKWIPRTDLVLLDGKEFAAIHVLPWSWKGLEKLREQNPSKLLQMLNKYLAAGTLHRWAVLDFVLGNTDRHGQNMMGDFETEELALIDHGSAMAGPSFDPAHDENSFVPFYLRVMTRGDFNSLDAQERLKRMPTVGTDVNEQLMQWLMSLDAHELEDILYRYGINPAPALQRLKAIREKVAESGRVDKTINALWVMT